MAIETKEVSYRAGDVTLRGYLAEDPASAGKRPGALVVHEWWGLNDYIRRRARMLAELGFSALAVDMYGEGRTGGNAAEATALMSAALADPRALEARFKAAHELLASRATVDSSKIAAIGYCFGGAVVLHAARIGMPLAAVVSFHGSLGSFHKPAPGSVKAKVLVCHGAADALVPEDQIEAFKAEMDAAGADYRFIAYPGALHGFTNPEADERGKENGIPLAYDAAVDARSWKDMQDLFAKAFR
jgi:dienelactone hydrolase